MDGILMFRIIPSLKGVITYGIVLHLSLEIYT
jgi:hypothetical protein